MARKGFPRKSDDVLDTVQKFLSENPRVTPFLNNRPGQGWLKAFLKRHPSLVPRTSEGDPKRVFNADETGFQLCPFTGRVLAAKGDKNIYAVEQGNSKENVTVLFTFSADGRTCPPLIVFPYKRLPEKIATSVPPKWGIGRRDTRWMTADVFNQFITELFAPYLAENNIKKPVILFIDGHKSHITLQLSLTCKELGVELVALYPNTTRITQPADVSVFGPIKKMYRKAVYKFQSENVGEVVTKLNIAIIIKAIVDDLKSQTIIKGFQACGLCPFDENAIDYSKCLGAPRSVEGTDRQTADYDENKIMSLKEFENIVGLVMIDKMKRLKSEGVMQNNSSPTLFKLWSFFHSDLPQKESTNTEIQAANNTTNVNLKE
ncbi:Tigger transposable element-derived protein 6 [Eumeta japonica]|uniref:Tigger transposable element-derived protein 6 n=1 Tax=Eumeta variegata TaxID=151549 RepID=A0A4C1U2C1_EUMVA|nr:Tigger transposable element-derived protein 6 [Eumeta japonica]